MGVPSSQARCASLDSALKWCRSISEGMLGRNYRGQGEGRDHKHGAPQVCGQANEPLPAASILQQDLGVDAKTGQVTRGFLLQRLPDVVARAGKDGDQYCQPHIVLNASPV